MAGKLLRAIGFQDHVGRRIVRGEIHRVGTIERTRGWKTNVVDGEIGDFGGHSLFYKIAALKNKEPISRGSG